MDRYQQYLARLRAAAERAAEVRGLQHVKAEVVLVLDVSKEMYPIYKAQILQELTSELLALSLNFDDDGVIPAYAFGDACRHLGDLTVEDFPGYVDREVIRTGADFQSRCCFAPVIDAVCQYYFPEDWSDAAGERVTGLIFKKTHKVYPMLSAPRAYPVFAMFVTTGDCDDKEATTDVIRRSSRLPIFWQFIGLSAPKGKPTKFRFLKKLDRLGNTYVDNCGFYEPTNVWDSTALFNGLLNEFPDYLTLPQVQGMLRAEDQGGRVSRGERDEPEASEPADTDTAAVDPNAGGQGAPSATPANPTAPHARPDTGARPAVDAAPPELPPPPPLPAVVTTTRARVKATSRRPKEVEERTNVLSAQRRDSLLNRPPTAIIKNKGNATNPRRRHTGTDLQLEATYTPPPTPSPSKAATDDAVPVLPARDKIMEKIARAKQAVERTVIHASPLTDGISKDLLEELGVTADEVRATLEAAEVEASESTAVLPAAAPPSGAHDDDDAFLASLRSINDPPAAVPTAGAQPIAAPKTGRKGRPSRAESTTRSQDRTSVLRDRLTQIRQRRAARKRDTDDDK